MVHVFTGTERAFFHFNKFQHNKVVVFSILFLCQLIEPSTEGRLYYILFS